ncbi:unnamed protein product [Laminaria digitata]
MVSSSSLRKPAGIDSSTCTAGVTARTFLPFFFGSLREQCTFVRLFASALRIRVPNECSYFAHMCRTSFLFLVPVAKRCRCFRCSAWNMIKHQKLNADDP